MPETRKQGIDNFQAAVRVILEHEGGYVKHPRDPGGATNYGITQRTAREHGYSGSMENLPLSKAKEIYRESYWLDEFDLLPYPVAFQVFDGAVNSGVSQSVRWLQRAVGVADDGKIGTVTVNAVLRTAPEIVIARYIQERLMFLTKLSTWDAFGKGWTRRIARNIELAAKHLEEYNT